MKLVIRADGNRTIGSGHVMRCCAVAARVLELGDDVVWWSSDLDTAMRRRVEALDVRVEPVPGTPAPAPGDVMLVDGYVIGDDLPATVRSLGMPVVRFDDGGYSPHTEADVIVDASPLSDQADYADATRGTKLLLGPQYAPVAAVYRKQRPPAPPEGTGLRRLLVSLGGNAPRRLLETVADGLEGFGGAVDLVLGGIQEDADSLASWATGRGWATHRDRPHLADLMAAADAAILAGGTTNWEACCVGLPRLMIQTADNQAGVARYLDDAGTGKFLGLADVVTPSTIRDGVEMLADDLVRHAMAAAGWKLVDGEGVVRIASHLKALCLEVRAAEADDARVIWEWANDPLTRQVSFSVDPIPWSDHVKWFTARLSDEAATLHVVAEPRGEPAAFVWYRHEPTGPLVVSINVAPPMRRHGIGPAALLASMHTLPPRTVVHAIIRQTNRASIVAFARAGFELDEPVSVGGVDAFRFAKRLS